MADTALSAAATARNTTVSNMVPAQTPPICLPHEDSYHVHCLKMREGSEKLRAAILSTHGEA